MLTHCDAAGAAALSQLGDIGATCRLLASAGVDGLVGLNTQVTVSERATRALQGCAVAGTGRCRESAAAASAAARRVSRAQRQMHSRQPRKSPTTHAV